MPLEQAVRIAEWLQSKQCPRTGRVIDSVHQVPGSYSDGFSALVFSLMGWSEPAERALEVSLGRSADSEFDSLAQALILHFEPNLGKRTQLHKRPLYQGKQLVSNNWALFRALTRELRGQAGDYSLLQRQLTSGLFPDSPVGEATPTCYHAKICAVLALRSTLLGNSFFQCELRNGLEALLSLVSPQGALAPYGRSRNTLFGYGAAYLALRLGSVLFKDGRLSWAANRLLEYITRYQTKDGHIPACLNANEWLRQDWDIYINNPDYNSFACACLIMAERLAPDLPTETPPEDSVVDLGPVLAVRHRQQYFACSTTGEFAPWGSPFFCDTRYAGMTPLIFDDGSLLRIFDTSYCWDGRDSTRSTLADPRVSDWIPYLVLGDKHFWARRFSNIVWNFDNEILSLRGRGQLSRAKPRKAWCRFLESRLTTRPALQMDVEELNIAVESNLTFDFGSSHLRLEAGLSDSNLVLQRAQLGERLCRV